MIIAPRWLIDMIASAKDDGLNAAIQAMGEAKRAVLAAKETEVAMLKADVVALREQVRYERARADALTDRLLVRDAKVFPVAPVAVEAAKKAEKDITERLEKIFSGMNEVGADVEEPGKKHIGMEFAGGGKAIHSTAPPETARV